MTIYFAVIAIDILGVERMEKETLFSVEWICICICIAQYRRHVNYVLEKQIFKKNVLSRQLIPLGFAPKIHSTWL